MYRYKSIFILCFSLFFSSIVIADSAFASQFVFVTGEQSIKPGQLSNEIIVQTQNNNGEAEKVSETQDMIFSSSSATGEFVNASGNAVTTTMSKNTSSRTFYYRDVTLGTHTLSVTIIGRETGKKNSATQEIVISSTGASTLNKGSKSTSVTAVNNQVSTHSSQSQTSELKKSETFKVDAGRKRVTTIHTPIEFNAETSLLEERKIKNRFDWSFGDGTSGRGKVIDHIYQFPGEYVVVLNSKQSETTAVARTEVRVIDPHISIIEIIPGENGYVELENPSEEEVNIGDWFFKADNIQFKIAKDTIMNPHSTLKIPLKLSNEQKILSLYFPSGVLASDFSKSKSVFASFDQESAETRTDILRQIVNLKRELAAALAEEDSAYMPPETEEETDDTARLQNKNDTNQTQKALLIESMKEEKKKGVVEFLKGIFGF